MTISNIEEIKAALVARGEREAAARRRTPRADRHPAPAPVQSDLADLRSLQQADPGMGKLGEILARRLDEQRKSVLARQAQERDAQQAQSDAAAAAATAAINARRAALSILAQPLPSPPVILETPFLIWELPNPDLSIFQGSGTVLDGSWVKILLDTQHTPDGQQSTDFRFYFIWQNETDYYAVANVSSALWLTGTASAIGSSGDFSGNWASLSLEAELNVIRWSGWGTDPVTGKSNDQTPYPIYDQNSYVNTVANLYGFGGDWFNHAKPESMTFDPLTPYELSASLIAIPGQAVTVFEVDLVLEWWFYNDHYETVDNQPQSISLDLASNTNRVLCPQVDLEILTPQSSA
ncbi:MAG TPA: hypothetical protein VMA73_27825 [Streptosporangiaceae bacterium]|nr:hypothetical protein [Streptosporangiaceae bacterium]